MSNAEKVKQDRIFSSGFSREFSCSSGFSSEWLLGTSSFAFLVPLCFWGWMGLRQEGERGVLGCSFAFCPLMAAVGRALVAPGCTQQGQHAAEMLSSTRWYLHSHHVQHELVSNPEPSSTSLAGWRSTEGSRSHHPAPSWQEEQPGQRLSLELSGGEGA